MSSTLPVIDIAPYWEPVCGKQASRCQVAQALHAACRDVGFFYLKVDAVLPKEEMRHMLELGREFFALKDVEKQQIGLEGSDHARGYQKLKQNVTLGKADYHEGLDYYAPNPYDDTIPDGSLRILEGSNPWPMAPPAFEGDFKAWIERMKSLGMAVMRGMADGLGCTENEWEELSGLVDESFWSMRIIGYPPLPDGADGISCGQHKDYGCLTFLLADPIPGSLQVLSRSNEWINADPRENCLVVNIGEMWDLWTGGLYPATLHRVIHRSPTYRVSVPFFFEPNWNANVTLLPAASRRLRDREGTAANLRDPKIVRYGDFLLKKVGGNFKYDDDTGV